MDKIPNSQENSFPTKLLIKEGYMGIRYCRQETQLSIVSLKTHKEVGVFEEASGRFTLIYQLSDFNQLKLAYNFRKLLREKNLHYEERPSKKEIAIQLREKTKELDSLAELIEN